MVQLEPAGLEGHRFDHLGTKQLERRDGVGQPVAGDRQGDQAETASSQIGRPGLAGAPGTQQIGQPSGSRIAQIAAPVDRIVTGLQQLFQHRDVVLWVVFQIGVLDDQVVAAGPLDPTTNRGALALVAGQPLEAHVRSAADDLGGSVRGAVVHDEHLLVHQKAGQIDGHDPVQQLVDESFLVVGRNDDRQRSSPSRAHVGIPSPAPRPRGY